MENQEGTFSILCCTISEKEKKNAVQAHKIISDAYLAKKPPNYGTVRIGSLNFTADEDVKSFSEQFSVEKDKNVTERRTMKLPEQKQEQKWQKKKGN